MGSLARFRKRLTFSIEPFSSKSCLKKRAVSMFTWEDTHRMTPTTPAKPTAAKLTAATPTTTTLTAATPTIMVVLYTIIFFRYFCVVCRGGTDLGREKKKKTSDIVVPPLPQRRSRSCRCARRGHSSWGR